MRLAKILRFLSISLLCLFTTYAVQAETVHIAVASNFSGPAKEIAQAFEQQSNHKTVLSFGSTGKFYTQIRHGAPFEVFLSADHERAQKTITDGLGVENSRFTYALGKIALFSRDSSLVQNSPDILAKHDAFTRLAIANPKTAPYGKAAIETLTHLKLLEGLEAKLVRGENIAQAYQFVATGNAQLGFVALSQIKNATDGSFWLVPQDHYSLIRQDAVLLKKGESNPAARAFLAFLQDPQARDIIARYGYGLE